MVTTLPFPCELRDAREDDTGFVIGSWLESHHRGSKLARRVRWADYRDPQRRICRRLLRRGVCVVACDPEAPDHLHGFALGERAGSRLVLHFVYVRQTRRRAGLASALVRELERRLSTRGITYTSETYVGEDVISRKVASGLDARFNPWLVWGEEAAA